jgi:2-oxoglutarate dehydrogenase E2 component (dihydrolipoamide succinyltransferase)
MAIVEVKVPQLSESVAEATMLQWKKKIGDAIAVDEILIEIETDKVVLEVPAPSAGVLVELLVADGGIVAAEQLIARIDTEATAGAGVSQPASSAAVSAAPAVSAAAPALPAAAPVAANRGTMSGVAMPAAAKLMADNNMAAGSVAGTGKDGRVTKGDVLGAASPVATLAPKVAAVGPISTGAAAKTLPQVVAPNRTSELAQLADRPEQRVPMSRLRARIAERLLQSQSTNAILTTFNEVNMAPVIDMRKRMQEKFEKEHGVKLGFMSFFVKAAVHALKKFPLLNASVDGSDVVYHGYFDIGIAVGSPRGLVVPILRNADQMSFAQIEKKIAEYGVKARDGKLGIEDMTGGTFSISNGGTFGSMLSTPIINPPQSAILGIHATKDRAVVENGVVVVRPMNYFAMSYDHRIIDGREAVLGLVAMKDALEDPARLLFDI